MKLQNAFEEIKQTLGTEDFEIFNLDLPIHTKTAEEYKEIFPVCYEAIMQLPEDGDKYICIDDLEGATWCVGCYGSLRAWGMKILDWAYADNYEDCDTEGNDWQTTYCYQLMNHFNPKTLIELISEIWQIEIIKLED